MLQKDYSLLDEFLKVALSELYDLPRTIKLFFPPANSVFLDELVGKDWVVTSTEDVA